MKRPILLVLLAGSLSGCVHWSTKSWRVQPPPPAAVVTEQHPKRIRVSRPDHTKIVLKNPSVIGDSLVATDARNRPVALPLAEVTQLEVEKTDGGKVALALVGLVGITVYLVDSIVNGLRHIAY